MRTLLTIACLIGLTCHIGLGSNELYVFRQSGLCQDQYIDTDNPVEAARLQSAVTLMYEFQYGVLALGNKINFTLEIAPRIPITKDSQMVLSFNNQITRIGGWDGKKVWHLGNKRNYAFFRHLNNKISGEPLQLVFEFEFDKWSSYIKRFELPGVSCVWENVIYNLCERLKILGRINQPIQGNLNYYKYCGCE